MSCDGTHQKLNSNIQSTVSWKDRLARLLGIDRAIVFVLLGRFWLALAGIGNLVAIGLWLTPDEQGYYYTFASVLAAQIFFELGLTTVVMQFASYESVRLKRGPDGRLGGDASAKARLASLVRLSLRWYGVLAVMFALGVGFVGWMFFNHNAGAAEQIPWKGAWVCLVAANAGLLWLSPLLAILEGCGQIAEIARLRLFQSIGAYLVLWIAFATHVGVRSPALFSLFSLVIGAAWVWKQYGALLVDLVRSGGEGRGISWRQEIFPYQWRIAVSYASGYFIMQLFTPVLFTYYGAAEAGRMGMSVSVTGAVSTLSLAWITTKAPAFGGLIAEKRFADLDALFGNAFKRTLAISALAAVSLMFCVWGLNLIGHPFADRFLVPVAFVPLVLSSFISTVLTAMAVYLRAFKREPFLVVSVLMASLVSALTYTLGRAYGSFAITMGYLVVNASVGLGLGWWIFIRKRREWTAVVDSA